MGIMFEVIVDMPQYAHLSDNQRVYFVDDCKKKEASGESFEDIAKDMHKKYGK